MMRLYPVRNRVAGLILAGWETVRIKHSWIRQVADICGRRLTGWCGVWARQWGAGCWIRWINRNPDELKMADSGAQQRKHAIPQLHLPLSRSPSLLTAITCNITAPYTSYRNPCWAIIWFFRAHFDSNDFIKPLILAWSLRLLHRWIWPLVSDSISREWCTAVAADAYTPPTLKCAGNLFAPHCSSSGCNSHSDKNPSLWYLPTKWEEGYREGGITYFLITIRGRRGPLLGRVCNILKPH